VGLVKESRRYQNLDYQALCGILTTAAGGSLRIWPRINADGRGSERRSQVFGFWFLVFGFWFLVFGFRF
jgi:hypothetical protein